MARGPTVIHVVPRAEGHKCCVTCRSKCCGCRCCPCLNFGYLRTHNGLIKLSEAMLGGLCQGLLVKYGMPQASAIGSAFDGFLTAASSCLLTTVLLMICYVFSANTHNVLKQSLFEGVFNGVACLLYLSASWYLWLAVSVFLYPRYAFYMCPEYPAISVIYVYHAPTLEVRLHTFFHFGIVSFLQTIQYIGAIVGALHGVDAFMAFKYLKGLR